MSVPPDHIGQIRRKQEEFLERLKEVSQLWTSSPLTEAQVLAAGAAVGLEPILDSEFLVYWVNLGQLNEEHFTAIAASIRSKR